MSPIRLILDDAPAALQIPEEFRHQRVEVIFWPLSEMTPSIRSETPRQLLARILAKPAAHRLRAITIDTRGFRFDREEANER